MAKRFIVKSEFFFYGAFSTIMGFARTQAEADAHIAALEAADPTEDPCEHISEYSWTQEASQGTIFEQDENGSLAKEFGNAKTAKIPAWVWECFKEDPLVRVINGVPYFASEGFTEAQLDQIERGEEVYLNED